MSFDVERPHDPTPARRQRARSEGRVARSPALVAAVVVLGGMLMLRHGGTFVVNWLGDMTRRHLASQPAVRFDASMAIGQLQSLALEAAVVLVPAMAVLFLLAVAINVGQVGTQWLPQRITPQWNRLIPWAEGRSPLGLDAGRQAMLALLQLALVVGIGAASVWGRRADLVNLAGDDLLKTAAALGGFTLDTGLHVGYAFVALGLVDYGHRWWRHEQSLRMSTEELREEIRQTEGTRAARAGRRATGGGVAALEPAAATTHSRSATVTPLGPTNPIAGNGRS